jgi:integrase/recombinase XerD
LSSYRRDLRRYAEYLERIGREQLSEVSNADVSAFLAHLREGDEEHQAAQRRQCRSHGGGCSWLPQVRLQERLVTTDVASTVKPPSPPKRLPKALTVSDIDAILAAAGAGGTSLALRDKALLEVLYGTAHASPRPSAGHRRPGPGSGVVLLRGKGGKQRVVPVGSYAIAAVQAYLVRGRAELVTRGTPALFLNARGGRLSRQSAWTVLVRTAERAGVAADVSPHTCGTPSLPTCSTVGPTYAWSKSCWGTHP